ncbi:MAG: 50S ribosomal protein L10, partial [Candidatus Hydrogenedentota bacterium]
LEEKPDFIMTRYTGLSVADITDLRKKLREHGVEYKVIKNKIFQLSLKEKEKYKDLEVAQNLTGAIAVAMVDKDFPAVAKVLKEYGKENEHVSLVGGVMDATYYDAEQVSQMAELPSKEQSLAMLASLLNAPATNIAGMMNQIMSSLARAIKAVGEKNG